MLVIETIRNIRLHFQGGSCRSVYTQFLRFAAVGAIGTAFHYMALYLLVEYSGSGPVLASSVGFVLGAVINYFLNYRFTFASEKLHTEALPKFFLVAILGLPLNSGVMAFYTSVIPLHYLLAQLLATGVVLIWNFTANRIWTFR